MAEIVMYSTSSCPYCVRARQLLERKGLHFTEIHIDNDPEKADEMITKSGKRTVPQIFINGQPIGGCDDLYALEYQGRLDQLIKG